MSSSASAIISADQNSAGATKSRNAIVRAKARGLDSEKAFSVQSEINDSLQDQLNTLMRAARASAIAASATPLTDNLVTRNGTPVTF